MSLMETRQSVATDLQEAGINAYTHSTRRVNPPCAIVLLDEPYVETPDVQAFNSEFKVNLVVYALVANATIDTMVNKLDDLIEMVIFNLGEWTVGGIQVDYWTVGENVYFGARIPITNTFNLGGNN